MYKNACLMKLVSIFIICLYTQFHMCVTIRLKIRCVIVVAAMLQSYTLQIHEPRNSFIPYKRLLLHKIRRPYIACHFHLRSFSYSLICHTEGNAYAKAV